MKRCIEAIELQLRKEIENTESLRTNSKKIKELSITLDSLVEYVAQQEEEKSEEESKDLDASSIWKEAFLSEVKQELCEGMRLQGMIPYNSEALGYEGRKFFAYKVYSNSDFESCLSQVFDAVMEEAKEWCEFHVAKMEVLKNQDPSEPSLARGIVFFKTHRYTREQVAEMDDVTYKSIESDLLIQVRRGLYK